MSHNIIPRVITIARASTTIELLVNAVRLGHGTATMTIKCFDGSVMHLKIVIDDKGTQTIPNSWSKH